MRRPRAEHANAFAVQTRRRHLRAAARLVAMEVIDDPHVREIVQAGQRVLRIGEGRIVQLDAAQKLGADGGLTWNGTLFSEHGSNGADRPE